MPCSVNAIQNERASGNESNYEMIAAVNQCGAKMPSENESGSVSIRKNEGVEKKRILTLMI